MKLKDTIHRNLYKHLFIIFLILICICVSGQITEADPLEVFNNADQISEFLQRFFHPDWQYLPKIIEPILKTIKISVVGTILGVIFAVPFACLGTTTITRNPIITTILRFFMSIIRTIPNLLLAALFVAMIGIGEFTGVLTIAVFTFGMVSQLIYEAIETVEHGTIEAADSVGATKTQVAFWVILPQISHQIFGYALYAFEINVRASTVLGYVGAGGIGVILNSSLSLYVQPGYRGNVFGLFEFIEKNNQISKQAQLLSSKNYSASSFDYDQKRYQQWLEQPIDLTKFLTYIKSRIKVDHYLFQIQQSTIAGFLASFTISYRISVYHLSKAEWQHFVSQFSLKDEQIIFEASSIEKEDYQIVTNCHHLPFYRLEANYVYDIFDEYLCYLKSIETGEEK